MRRRNRKTQELDAMNRLSSLEGAANKGPSIHSPRMSAYEGGARRPGFGPGNRQPGYFGLSKDSGEKDIMNFQGLLTYQVTLVNADPATRIARITPANLGETAPGLIQDGPFTDINGAAGLTGSTTSAGTIAELIRFITFNPTKLLAMKVSSTDEDQSEETINALVSSPFRQLESKVIPLSQYTDGETFNPKKTFVNLLPYDLQLDGQADIRLPIVGSSTAKILLFAGPILNPAQILDSQTRNL